MRGSHLRNATLVAVLALALLATGAVAQRSRDAGQTLEPEIRETVERRIQRERLASEAQARAFEAIGRGDLEAAEAALREQIKHDPGDFVPRYNLACVLAQRGSLDEAAMSLIGAVERGFSDRWQLTRDPHLASLRSHESYLLLVNNWDQILEAAAEARFEQLRREYGPAYAYERDPSLRINIASGFDAESTRRAHEEIRLLTAWAIETIFPELADPPMSAADPWVSVILPTERDFLAWAIVEYGPSAALGDMNRIGGAYSHDRKQLVSMDLGGTFRHEFLHVLHHRSATRMGQAHPIWIQEGLCALVEDYDMVGGVLTPTASWRTNSVKRLERGGGLQSIGDLARMPRGRFTATRPLANYAHARAVFLFLSQRGQLGAWYAHYSRNWSIDASGVRSLESVLGMEIDAVDAEFRRWLRALEEVPETVSAGGASIGLEIDPGRGEGPIITRVIAPGARAAGLRPQDVITAIDGRPTRDFHELARVLGSYTPGRTVVIDYRRRREHGQATVTLDRAR